MSTNIYILKLKDNNYYVGKAKDVNKIFQEHISGNGSSWTKKHKPIEIIKVINNCSSFEEDKQVKELMSLHGIDKVRGGTYTKIDLTKEEKDILQKEIWGAKDVCTRCGNSNHFVKDCYAKTNINGCELSINNSKNKSSICIENKKEEIIIWECDKCKKEFEDCNECIKHEKICKQKPTSKVNKKQKCKRCGRQNHNENNCYASTHVDGYELEDSNDSSEYSDSDDELCFRCGREGHFANDCYAKKHIKGYYIK
jgi:predicted GIY-YIG superfamily endonuclease